MSLDRFNPVYQKESQPESELFTLTITNDEENIQSVIVYLEIWPAAHIDYREIYATIKMPILISISPNFPIDEQLQAALSNEGIRGRLESVTGNQIEEKIWDFHTSKIIQKPTALSSIRLCFAVRDGEQKVIHQLQLFNSLLLQVYRVAVSVVRYFLNQSTYQ